MRLMVVDDDKNIRDIVRFGTGNITVCNSVVPCASAEEAEKAFYPGQFDCLIVDYKLPGMNGIEFIRKVREQDEKVGIVLVTAVLDQETAERACEDLSVYSVVMKPFALKNLAQKIAEAAELARMPAEKQEAIGVELDKQSATFKDLGSQIRKELGERKRDTGMMRRRLAF